jgi:hypothetical protein
MTTKKFERLVCDRCGCTEEAPDDDISRGWARLSSPCRNNSGYGVIAEIPPLADLCPACRTSLIHWWRQEADARKEREKAEAQRRRETWVAARNGPERGGAKTPDRGDAKTPE